MSTDSAPSPGSTAAEPAASSASTGGAGGACFSFRSPPTSAVGRRGGVLSFGGNGGFDALARGGVDSGESPALGGAGVSGAAPPPAPPSVARRPPPRPSPYSPPRAARSSRQPARAGARALVRRPRRPRGASRQPDGAGEHRRRRRRERRRRGAVGGHDSQPHARGRGGPRGVGRFEPQVRRHGWLGQTQRDVFSEMIVGSRRLGGPARRVARRALVAQLVAPRARHERQRLAQKRLGSFAAESRRARARGCALERGGLGVHPRDLLRVRAAQARPGIIERRRIPEARGGDLDGDRGHRRVFVVVVDERRRGFAKGTPAARFFTIAPSALVSPVSSALRREPAERAARLRGGSRRHSARGCHAERWAKPPRAAEQGDVVAARLRDAAHVHALPDAVRRRRARAPARPGAPPVRVRVPVIAQLPQRVHAAPAHARRRAPVAATKRSACSARRGRTRLASARRRARYSRR